MTEEKRPGPGGKPDSSCAAWGKGEPPRYWCEVCEKELVEKRCPSCGLKARKIR
jgi:hypothetical protein